MDLPSPVASHRSATFEERGASVPFTTPALAGARVRRDARHGLVLVVSNPAGGRSVYVLPWSAVRDMCHPTLHDGMLYDHLSASRGKPITPGTVRIAARRVATDGAAGRPALAAALKAVQADTDSCQASNQYLLSVLAAQTAVRADLTEVATLAVIVDEIGIGPHAARASVPVRLSRLKAFHKELAALSRTATDETGYLAMTCGMAAMAIHCADAVMAAARVRLADIGALLAGLRNHASELAALVGRPAWVLDGWDLPCLLWEAASDAGAQRAALNEIGPALAVLPHEAEQWVGASTDVPANHAVRRIVGVNQDWRTGVSTLEVVARNERFRALAA